jgi:hypothetical protein
VKFLALSPAIAWSLLAGVALAIVLLHLLRPPPPRVVVPSLLLWMRVARDRKRPAANWLTLLLLALGAGLSIALALTRPEIPGFAVSAQHLTLILDNSPSMSARTRDGSSRWQHAVARATEVLQRSGAASRVTLMDTGGKFRASGFVDRKSAIAALARLPAVDWESARVPLAIPAGGGQVHLFTDGVAPIEPPEGALVHSVFEPADNIAVTAFEVRALPQDPTRVEALVQVLNASPSDQRARLLIKGGESFSIAQDLDLRPGETVNAAIDISDFVGGVLGATVIGLSDALLLDDLAYAIVPPHRPKRVLLVTPGNPDLVDALRTMPGVVLTVVGPEGYSAAGEHDALVFDRFAPAEPPASGALLLRPPLRNWLAGEPVAMVPARITHWNHDHVVTRGVAWSNLRLERASVEVHAKPSEALVAANGPASGALVTAGEARARWVKVGFALQDSNFRMQPDFPVFLGNALRWVTERTPVLTRGLGSIEVAVPNAEVRNGSGRPVATASTVHGVVFQAPSPDVYSVSGRDGQILVVANLTDPRFVHINQTTLAAGSGAAGGSSPTSPWYPEPWMLLLLAACVLLVVEWAVYTRRVRT